jgi:hypothetical protein
MSVNDFGKHAAEQPGKNLAGARSQPSHGEVSQARQADSFAAMGQSFLSPSAMVAQLQAARDHGAVHGPDHAETPHRSPSQIVADLREAAGKERASGEQEMAQLGRRPGQSWVEWLNEQRDKSDGNASDSYERDRNRNLPEEELDNSRDLGR